MARFLAFPVLALLLVVGASANEVDYDDEYDGEEAASAPTGTIYSFELEHSLSGADQAEAFSARARVDLQMSKLSAKASVKVSGRNNLDPAEASRFEQLVGQSDFYRIRVRSNSNDPESPYIVASIKAVRDCGRATRGGRGDKDEKGTRGQH